MKSKEHHPQSQFIDESFTSKKKVIKKREALLHAASLIYSTSEFTSKQSTHASSGRRNSIGSSCSPFVILVLFFVLVGPAVPCEEFQGPKANFKNKLIYNYNENNFVI